MIQGNPDANEIAQMKKTILEKYDDNFDGKLDLEEVSSLSLCLADFQEVENFKCTTMYCSTTDRLIWILSSFVLHEDLSEKKKMKGHVDEGALPPPPPLVVIRVQPYIVPNNTKGSL